MKNYILFRGLLPAVAEKCGWSNYTETAVARRRSWRSCNISIRSLPPHRQSFRRPILSPATPARASFTSRPATVWTTTIWAARMACRFIRRWTTMASLRYTNDLPVEQQMPAEMVGKSILEKHGKSDANEAVLHELRVAPRAAAPGKLSSQLSALLAQQDAHHLPRDGPVVHQD